MNLEEYLAAPPLEQTEKLLGATSAEEQAFCRWFAEHGLVQGTVVEFGPWLGSLTIPTAIGLSKNTRVPPGGGIETYDLFHWNQGFENWVLGTPYEGRCKPGDSYLPLFEEIVAPYVRQGMVRPHAEDLAQARWTGQPIEFLINDAWKAVPVMSQTIREFFPSLSLGAVVFHQDYLWSSDSLHPHRYVSSPRLLRVCRPDSALMHRAFSRGARYSNWHDRGVGVPPSTLRLHGR